MSVDKTNDMYVMMPAALPLPEKMLPLEIPLPQPASTRHRPRIAVRFKRVLEVMRSCPRRPASLVAFSLAHGPQPDKVFPLCSRISTDRRLGGMQPDATIRACKGHCRAVSEANRNCTLTLL